MDKAKFFWSIVDKICLSIGGMTILEAIGSGIWNISFLDGIDNTLKTLTAVVAFAYLLITLPFKISIMKVDKKRKLIDNEIKEFEKKKIKEELRKIELENKLREKELSREAS
jgi:preprotein translocase subunit SecG